jgi:hypothetical protein
MASAETVSAWTPKADRISRRQKFGSKSMPDLFSAAPPLLPAGALISPGIVSCCLKSVFKLCRITAQIKHEFAGFPGKSRCTSTGRVTRKLETGCPACFRLVHQNLAPQPPQRVLNLGVNCDFRPLRHNQKELAQVDQPGHSACHAVVGRSVKNVMVSARGPVAWNRVACDMGIRNRYRGSDITRRRPLLICCAFDVRHEKTSGRKW